VTSIATANRSANEDCAGGAAAGCEAVWRGLVACGTAGRIIAAGGAVRRGVTGVAGNARRGGAGRSVWYHTPALIRARLFL
jgi:hypothetical protein